MQSLVTSQVGRRFLFGASAAVILAACSCAGDGEVVGNGSVNSIDLHGTVVRNDAGSPNDPITIESARVVADTLIALVSHGGGCAEHSYQLVIGTAWMESFPVQVRARVAHNAKGDMCDALLKRELRMSLRPLADAYRASYKQEHGTVAVQLTGVMQGLMYVF